MPGRFRRPIFKEFETWAEGGPGWWSQIVVKIRMSRLGRPHRPFYRISAVDSRVKRDGKVIETLGWYDPMASGQQIELKADRIKHWLSVGAQPSDTVKDLLAKNGLVDMESRKKEHAARAAASQAGAAKRAAAGEKKDGEKKA